MDSNPLTKDFVEDFDNRSRCLRFSFVQTQCPWIARLISTIWYWFYKFQCYYYFVYYLQIPFQAVDLYILKSPQLRFKSCALRIHFYSCGLWFLGLRFLSQRIYYQCHAFWAVKLICSGIFFFEKPVPDLILAVIIAIIILLYSSLLVGGGVLHFLSPSTLVSRVQKED